MLRIQAIQKLFKTLKEAGLTVNEVNTYLTILDIGQNAASTIAKKAGLNRCSTYGNLEELMKKGFIQKVIKKTTNFYTAVEPRIILEQLKRKRLEMDENIDQLENSIAELEMVRNDNPCKPKIIFYEGISGIRNIMEDTLNTIGELRAYASMSELNLLLPNYFQQYYARRVERGITVRAIYPADEQSYQNKLRDREELRETRLIPPEFNFHLDILVYNNKVAITSLEENFGVLIESRQMAEAQKKIFDFIWEGTKQYDDIMTTMMAKKVMRKETPEETFSTKP